MFRKLWSHPAAAEDLSPVFLAAISLEELEAVLAPLRRALGPVVRFDISGDQMVVTTARHVMRGRIALDHEDRVALLFLEPPEPLELSLAAIERQLRGLGRDVSWLAMDGTDVVSQHAPQRALAVGSVFKLAVLAVLLEDIRAGRRGWSDVVFLQELHRALPSGILQDWPAGSALTLHSVAALMISQSDNTATNMLMAELGHGRIAAKLGLAHVLDTRAFFGLKADPELARRYGVATTPDAKEQLARTARLNLADPGRATGHHVAGVEWYLPATRICALLSEIGPLGIMAIAPGPIARQDWASLAYKGGSEPGVLSLATRLTRLPEGQDLCAVLSINHDGPIDQPAAQTAYRQLVRFLRDRP